MWQVLYLPDAEAERQKLAATATGKKPIPGYLPAREGFFVIAAICPEAIKDPEGFRRGCAIALERLAELDETAEEE
jgi:hypothetical protein